MTFTFSHKRSLGCDSLISVVGPVDEPRCEELRYEVTRAIACGALHITVDLGPRGPLGDPALLDEAIRDLSEQAAALGTSFEVLRAAS